MQSKQNGYAQRQGQPDGTTNPNWTFARKLSEPGISADKSPGFLRTVAGGPLHLCLEEVDDVPSGHPLEGIPAPAPLDHVPHVIRDFRVIWSRWSVVLEYRKYHCSFDLSGEWWFPREDLPTPTGEYLETERRAKNRLTSHASIPNANISVALVVRARTSPKVCGLMSSGATPQNNLSAAVSDQPIGSERENADPKPPKRATPLLPTSIFLLKGVSTLRPWIKVDNVPS